jgi:hypothetical protein
MLDGETYDTATTSLHFAGVRSLANLDGTGVRASPVGYGDPASARDIVILN